MELILKLPERPSIRDILETISSAEECVSFSSKQSVAITAVDSDSTSLGSELRRKRLSRTNLAHNDIRFNIKKLEKTCDKVFVLIQVSIAFSTSELNPTHLLLKAILGGISLNSPEYRTGDSQPHLEALAIFRHVCRITRAFAAVVEVSVVGKRGAQMKHGLELLRCLSAKAWEDRPVVLRQIEQIGEKSLKVLAENGIVTLQVLQQQPPSRIELLLNRRPPFGQEVLASMKELPQYTLDIQQSQLRGGSGTDPIEVDLTVHCGLVDRCDNVRAKKVKRREANMTVVYAVTSDMDFIDFRRIPTKGLNESRSFSITATLTKPSQTITVTISSETAAGVALQRMYKPNVPPGEYPVPDTRPPTILEMEPETKPESLNIMNQTLTARRAKASAEEKRRQGFQHAEAEMHTAPYVKDLTTLRENSIILHKLDHSDPKNKQLPNGNYECNHSCKEKSSCRHLCCKEGLVKPSKKQGKQETVPAKQNKGLKSGNDQWLNNESSRDKQKCHPILVDLESRHTSAEVEKGLKIKSGQRIRLHYSPRGQSTACRAESIVGREEPKYYDDGAKRSIHDTVGQTDFVANDDITLGSDYSDSEMDSIIRALPMDDDQVETTKTPSHEKGGEASQSIELKKRKTPLFFEEPLPLLKRPKIAGELRPASPVHSDDSEVEIIEAGPLNTKPDIPIQLNNNEEFDVDSEIAEELAALEEWLNSGAVEIINDL
ncbi:hypothetical protein APHAL10511_001065 [Amanita phalloides]|nr:hypothetical protein APHAL10511_001065 [Amanita phalloides]